MSHTIDADAAKLAGLLIDTSTKLRSGQLSLSHWERFLNLSPDAREDRFGDGKKPKAKATAPAESTEKFALLADLGIITVPDDYMHEKRLTTFDEQNRKKFYYYNDEITDKNFPNPTRVLKPGDKLRVRAFKQVVDGTTTSVERMAFLATQNAIHTGAQGASLVFEEKRDQLPKRYWCASFDEKDRLWADADGRHRVPRVFCNSDGVFRFDLGSFENVWSDGSAFLCFCDVE
jgi:hypothetical protein